MAAFHLDFKPKPLEEPISHYDGIVLAGSCFAGHIGERLIQAKFQALCNPYGILFNPLSIASCLHECIENTVYDESRLIEHNGLWHSLQHHSRFSHPNKASCLEHINESIALAHKQLKEAKWLILTFGSAHAYYLKENGRLAGNCHKLPQLLFDKYLQTQEEIVSVYHDLVEMLREFNPSLNIIFTVSPVRYIRDGLVENTLSKSVLISAVHRLCDAYTHVHYFPAYELVTDDLRDYRFYEDDLVHPNAQAINYVWQKFCASAVDKDTQKVMQEIQNIQAAMKHRPFRADTAGHQAFRAQQLKKIQELQSQYPRLDLSVEEEYFSKQQL